MNGPIEQASQSLDQALTLFSGGDYQQACDQLETAAAALAALTQPDPGETAQPIAGAEAGAESVYAVPVEIGVELEIVHASSNRKVDFPRNRAA